MKRYLFSSVSVIFCTFLMILACSDIQDDSGFVVPVPTPDKEQDKEENNGKDDDQVAASLCSPEYLGQTPMIIAYYTENSSAVPDPACLTHINYAHGRFVNKETGDGGSQAIWSGWNRYRLGISDKFICGNFVLAV